jgi:2-amino-4-hydroxy-6-hydroxymethyldihydropteridine diphosphokinase
LNKPYLAAMGSNLGDRDAHLDFALARLAPILSHLRASSRHETTPVDVVGVQPLFLNMAVVGETSLAPLDLLGVLQRVEQERGRTRPFPNAPRTLDLDLVLYGELIVDLPALRVPHPRFRDRRFVLAPLAEIAPDLRDPITGLTVDELLRKVPAQPTSRTPGV